MDDLYEMLAPATDWLPEEVRAYLPVEAWWMVELVAVLAALVVAGYLLRGLMRAVFRRRHRDVDWDRPLRESLDSCPMPNVPPAALVYHVPARLRLVVVAPGGKGVHVPDDVSAVLDRAVPGLGALVVRDQPQVTIWPAQLSTMGFTNLFHRCTPTAERPGEPSSWVLLAGRAQQSGGESLFIGLGLWSEQRTTLGRRNLEPHQWLDVLRLDAGRAV
jgi:hypothetical protein